MEKEKISFLCKSTFQKWYCYFLLIKTSTKELGWRDRQVGNKSCPRTKLVGREKSQTFSVCIAIQYMLYSPLLFNPKA